MPFASSNASYSPKKSLVGWATSFTVNLVFWVSIVVPFSYHKMWPVSLVVSIIYSIGLSLCIRKARKAMEAGEDNDQGSNTSGGEGGQEETISGLPGETTSSASSLPPGIEPTRSADPLASPGGESDSISYERSADDCGNDHRSIPLYLSLLYGLFALSVGVPGAIVATKAFPCHFDPDGWHNPSNANKRKPTWKTDVSVLPEAVQKWNQIRDPYDRSMQYFSSHSYAQLDGTAEGNVSVYFVAAKPNGSQTQLQVMSSGSIPQEIVGFNQPSWLTSVSDQYVCLQQTHESNQSKASWRSPPTYSIACGNEALGFNSTERFRKGIIPVYLAGIEDLLWFQQSYSGFPPGRGVEAANGYAIVSIDPANMDNMTIHSTLEPPEYHDGDGLCGGDEVIVALSIPAAACLLFLSALPMALLSGWFWYKRAIPSSSLTLFFSVGLIIGCLFAFGEPEAFQFGLYIWMILAAPIWLFVCSYILAVSPRVARQPLEWFVCTISSFYVLWTTWFNIGTELTENYWDYAPRMEVVPATIFNLLFIFFPICLYGIILRSTYVICLGGMGMALFASNATFVLLVTKSIPLVILLIIVECVAIFAGTRKVLHAKGHLQKVLVDGLRKCTSYLCGRARSDAEMELAESLLLIEETEVRADSNVADAEI